MHLAGHEVGVATSGEAAIGYVQNVDCGHRLEQFAGHVKRCADARGCKHDRSRVSLRVGDELGNRLNWKRRTNLHHVGDAHERRHRDEVAQYVEAQLVIKRRVDSVRYVELNERVSVGGRAHHLLGGEIAGSADPVLDDELLPETLGQPLCHQARGEIATTARRKADHKTHRPRRIGLRPCDARNCWQRGRAGGQMQKSSAGKFHSALPEYGRWWASRHHSGLMLAARITLPHFSVSSAMNLPKSAGVIGIGVPPKSSSRAFIFGSARAALVSLLSFSTMSAGVFLGAQMPYQIVASYPGTNSPKAGMSCRASERIAVVTPKARTLPDLMYSIDEVTDGNMTCTWPPSKSVSAGPLPR